MLRELRRHGRVEYVRSVHAAGSRQGCEGAGEGAKGRVKGKGDSFGKVSGERREREGSEGQEANFHGVFYRGKG